LVAAPRVLDRVTQIAAQVPPDPISTGLVIGSSLRIDDLIKIRRMAGAATRPEPQCKSVTTAIASTWAKSLQLIRARPLGVPNTCEGHYGRDWLSLG
jgi:hypothetical protein